MSTAESAALLRRPLIRPANAATLILLDDDGPEPRVLMGRRNANMTFMPGKFVFPGGRVDATDRQMVAMGALAPRAEARLLSQSPKLSPQGCRALAMAAIRETFEETGLMIGTSEFGAPERSPGGTWDAFREAGVHPTPDSLAFLARAITPPGRPRRFDTRFFVARRQAVGHEQPVSLGPDSELTELVWVTLGDAVALDLPVITQIIIRELADRLAVGIERDVPVPFYVERRGTFVRDLL